MRKFFVYPYMSKSHSAKKLTEALNATMPPPSTYKYDKDNHVLINWGCGDIPYSQALNSKIMDVIEKTRFFKRLEGTGFTPEYATTIEGAKALGFPIFCRTETQGHDGKGCFVADCVGQLKTSKLYVKGIDKTSEYRVHVGRLPDGTVKLLGGAKKIKKPITPDMTNVPSDNRIWTGDSVAFGDFAPATTFPAQVQACVLGAFKVFSELSFAAFDVVYDNSAGKAYVIEANSAPMSTPMTTKAYAAFFTEFAEMLDALAPKVTPSPVTAASVAKAVAAPAPTPAVGVKATRSVEEIAKAISENIAELIVASMPKAQS